MQLAVQILLNPASIPMILTPPYAASLTIYRRVPRRATKCLSCIPITTCFSLRFRTLSIDGNDFPTIIIPLWFPSSRMTLETLHIWGMHKHISLHNPFNYIRYFRAMEFPGSVPPRLIAVDNFGVCAGNIRAHHPGFQFTFQRYLSKFNITMFRPYLQSCLSVNCPLLDYYQI